MRPRWGESDLNGEIIFDRYLGAGDELEELQTLIRTVAPKWSSKLRLRKGPNDERPIDVGRSGDLKSALLAAAAERGSTYRALVEKHGIPPFERLTGSVELRGANPELVVVVSVDEMIVSPLGSALDLGNTIAVRLSRRVGRTDIAASCVLIT
jgi:hypothetical protein